jgi:hypothetical protein
MIQEYTGSLLETNAHDACRGQGRGGFDRRDIMAGKRSSAKIGMSLSLGALVVTGFMPGRGAKTLHVWSGLALIGFSIWHHNLYRR